jgi:hypothetical protein
MSTDAHHGNTPKPKPVPVWEHSFSIQEALTVGWNTFLANWQLFLTIQFATSLVIFLASFFSERILEGTLLRFCADILKLGLQLIIGLGLMFVYLRVYDGEKTEPLDIFDPLPLFWGYAGVMVLYVIGVGIGLLLLVVPGVLLAAGWSLAHYIVIETDSNPVDALKLSWKKTEGHKLNIVLFGAIACVLNFLGMLFFGLGLLVTLPVTGLAYAYIYRYFFPKTKEVQV